MEKCRAPQPDDLQLKATVRALHDGFLLAQRLEDVAPAEGLPAATAQRPQQAQAAPRSIADPEPSGRAGAASEAAMPGTRVLCQLPIWFLTSASTTGEREQDPSACPDAAESVLPHLPHSALGDAH